MAKLWAWLTTYGSTAQSPTLSLSLLVLLLHRQNPQLAPSIFTGNHLLQLKWFAGVATVWFVSLSEVATRKSDSLCQQTKRDIAHCHISPQEARQPGRPTHMFADNLALKVNCQPYVWIPLDLLGYWSTRSQDARTWERRNPVSDIRVIHLISLFSLRPQPIREIAVLVPLSKHNWSEIITPM